MAPLCDAVAMLFRVGMVDETKSMASLRELEEIEEVRKGGAIEVNGLASECFCC
jgi:hypothetical protein